MGWIILTYNPGPVCMWITAKESCILKICLDERLYGDTIFRAEKVRDTYVISDVLVYNAVSIHNSTTFKQRYDWSSELIKRFYRPGLAKLLHKSELPEDTKLRGHEYYDFSKGSHGYFVELDESETIVKTELPDVYLVRGKQGYVLVPDLRTSEFLRSKGSEFKMKCVEKNGNWEVILPS